MKLDVDAKSLGLPEMPRLTIDGQARSTHDLITREIAKRIFKGTYRPGDALPAEGDMLGEFRASRTALREALKTLAAKGMIVAKTRVGTRVLPAAYWNYYDPQVLSWRLENGADGEFLARLYEVRQALEPAAAALAAANRTTANLNRLEQYLNAMRGYHANRQSYAEPDIAFHQEVLKASHNPFFEAFSSVIEGSILCAFEISAPVDSPERQARSIRRHQKALEAIRAGDAAQASLAMSEVIGEGRENARLSPSAPLITVALPMAQNLS